MFNFLKIDQDENEIDQLVQEELQRQDIDLPQTTSETQPDDSDLLKNQSKNTEVKDDTIERAMAAINLGMQITTEQ